MSQTDETTKVKVGSFTVGIVGLQAAVEEDAQKEFSSDEEIADHLLQVLKKRR